MPTALFVALGLMAPQEPAAYDAPPVGSVCIARDEFGVPHVIAKDERSLFFGVGYGQAQDQIRQLSKNYLQAAGRLAEVEGERQLAADRLARSMRLRERATAGLPQLDPEILAQFEAFADGVNHYIAERRDALPSWIQPVSVVDGVALALYVDMMFAVRGCERDLRRAGIEGLRRLVGLPRPLPPGVGSNQFAVGPERSATGAAMISMDPHLPLFGVTLWYEMHLVGPGVNVMGATFPGLPYVAIGRTRRTAWSMTVNGADLGDVFRFTVVVDPERPDSYTGPEGPETFAVSEEEFGVLVDGEIEQRKWRLRQTSVGPVIAEGGGRVYAFALPWHESLRSLRQAWDMARAADQKEFVKSLEQLGVSMFNIVYADADGHLYYVSNQRVAVRDQRIRPNRIRPGDEKWAHWQGYHVLADLPQLSDPDSGYLLNTNSGPQNLFPRSPLEQSDFPRYMTRHKHNSRSLRLTQLLRRDDSVTWQEMHGYATDTYLGPADQWVPLAVRLLEQHADDYEADAEILLECASQLKAWDRRADIDSAGAALFGYLSLDPTVGRAFLERASPDVLLPAVARAARVFVEKFGSLDVPWGAFSRIRRGSIDLPCAGHGTRGAVALRPTSGRIADDGRRYAEIGSSYNMIVDFSGASRSSSCLPFGISEDPDSPHFADQMALYSQGRMKPAWFSPEELAAHTESRLVIQR